MTYYIGTKTPAFVDITKSDFPTQLSMGIYVGTVKQHDLETRSGRLWVYIPGFGTDPEISDTNSNGWITVNYASPFLGYTESNTGVSLNNFESTGQSYGFSIPIPDIGSEVLCCFPAGRKEKNGYWFACVNSRLSRHMVPAIGSIRTDNIDIDSIPPSLQPLIDVQQNYPVGEFSELYQQTQTFFTDDWYKQQKLPLHIPRTIQYLSQGLDADTERGPITSSNQRDPISTVFGVSTPGRPINDNEQNLAVNANLDNNTAKNFKTTSRFGGHSIVMDDGNFGGDNNLIRIRSSAGHQITLNDTEGFIYITTASGKGYIELTADGQLIIYNANDISVRSENNIMFHADQNFQVNAKKIYLNADEELKLQSTKISAAAGDLLNLYGRKSQLRGGQVTVNSARNLSLSGAGSVVVGGDTIYLNSGASVASFSLPTSLRNYNFTDVKGVVLTDPSLAKYTNDNSGSFSFWKETENTILKSINYRVPTHEPYNRNKRPNSVGQANRISGSLLNNPTLRSFTSTTGAQDIDSEVKVKPGIANAVREPLSSTKKADSSVFIKEANAYPAPASIGNLDRNALTAYKAQIGFSESRNNFIPASPGSTVEGLNSAGYAGKYQLGSAALQDLGYLKPGTPQTVEAMNNPNNWIGGSGKPSNLQEFLNSPEIQEQAMYNYTNANYERLTKLQVINQNTSPELTAGYLSASHLGGPDNVADWSTKGQNKFDSNGTSLSQYFNLGRYSQSQVPTITASLQSKGT